MLATLIDGTKSSRELIETLRPQTKHQQIGLIDVVIGENALSHKLADLKGQRAQKLGINFQKKHFTLHTPQSEILKFITEQNRNPKVHGIIIQLPIPENYQPLHLLSAIDPIKDVDCLTPTNLGLLLYGEVCFLPPVVLATMQLILTTERYPTKQRGYLYQQVTLPDLQGVSIVLLGSGLLVGKPLLAFLVNEGATVSVVNEFTPDRNTITLSAEIIITGTNQKDVLQPEFVKDDAVVVNVGDDLEMEKFNQKKIYISKNPGGVGPLTIAYLLMNTVISFHRLTQEE
jgi:methylenetetrahydrofolate dehydrogenase (NADP+)/methenyltetrahydrofolate cyclohydrolase